MVGDTTAGLSRRLHEPSEHERLVREVLPDDVADAYLELTVTGGRPAREGHPVDQELVDRHLAYLHRGPAAEVLRPVDSLIAVTGLLTEVHREVTKQHDRLLQGYVAAAEVHQLQLHDRSAGEVSSVLAQVLTDPNEIAERWKTSIHTVQCAYRSITVDDPDLPLPSQLNAQCSGMSFRELCTPDFVADPRGAEAVRSAVEAGVQVRTVRTLPTRMVIVDDHFALIGLVPNGETAALLVRSSVLIGAFTQYYDRLWASATPVVPARSAETKGLGATEQEVLALLVHGLKDEAIARHLKLSVRTVRRHIATVMEFVDAPTRFAAGAAAQRLGLLGDHP
ncbi:response regulator transcription factor [Kribbella sp. NPDC050124]|uniref:response regulator transcription factor n=1 Tax=Kribbella sp. NPDC050124 TaxID=3364114 RepID=UPI00378E04AF